MKVMLDINIFTSMIFPAVQTKEFTKEHQIVMCDYVIEELRLVVK